MITVRLCKGERHAELGYFETEIIPRVGERLKYDGILYTVTRVVWLVPTYREGTIYGDTVKVDIVLEGL